MREIGIALGGPEPDHVPLAHIGDENLVAQIEVLSEIRRSIGRYCVDPDPVREHRTLLEPARRRCYSGSVASTASRFER